MSSSRKADEQAIVAAGDALTGTGYFTHVYVEAGRQDATAPSFVWSHLPNGEDVFDLASMTKALVTVPLVGATKIHGKTTLSELALLAPTRPIDLPHDVGQLSVSSVLNHSSGLPAWTNFWINRLNDTVTANELRATAHDHIATVMRRRSQWLAGEGADRYSDIGFIILGALYERMIGEGIEHAFTRLAGAPSGKSWLGYLPPPEIMSRTISCGTCAVRGRELKGEVHDENCAALGGVTGHAGLFGTGAGVRQWLQRFWNSDGGASFRGAGCLGWRKADDPSSRGFGHGHAIGHMGFTGTAFWLIPSDGRYGIVLTNRVISGRVSEAIKIFRAETFSRLDRLA